MAERPAVHPTDGMRVRFSSVGLWEVGGVFFLFPAFGFFCCWQHSVMKTKVSRDVGSGRLLSRAVLMLN